MRGAQAILAPNRSTALPWDFDMRDYWPIVPAGKALVQSFAFYGEVEPQGYRAEIVRYKADGLFGAFPNMVREDFSPATSPATLIDNWRVYRETNPDGSGCMIEWSDYDAFSNTYSYLLPSPINHGGRQRLGEIHEQNVKQDPALGLPPNAGSPSNWILNQNWYQVLYPAFRSPHGTLYQNVMQQRLYQAYFTTYQRDTVKIIALVDYFYAPGQGQIGLKYYGLYDSDPILYAAYAGGKTSDRWVCDSRLQDAADPIAWNFTAVTV